MEYEGFVEIVRWFGLIVFVVGFSAIAWKWVPNHPINNTSVKNNK